MTAIKDHEMNLERVDLSFMPSLRCDLSCSFCMYDCGPANYLNLDVAQARRFIGTVDWTRVSMCGFYGGEPAINATMYEGFMAMLPRTVDKFVITNGSWSTNVYRWKRFLRWCVEHELHIVISGTPEHKAFQDEWIIDMLSKSEGVTVKGDDDIHPMGRARTEEWTCSRKCTYHKTGVRLGVFPTGDVMLQNCDGVYPIVGNIRDNTFDELFKAGVEVRTNDCVEGRRNINDVMAEVANGAQVEKK